MASVSVTCPGLTQLRARLQALAQTLPSVIEPANAAIVEEVHSGIEAAYGPHLGKRWDVTSEATEIFAEVRAFSTDPYVLGYEFGTRPHSIRPRRARVLHFSDQGVEVFTRHVSHPGTKPHNRRDLVALRLAIAARSYWRQAIADALHSV